MDVAITHHGDTRLLVATLSGRFSLKAAEHTFLQILEAAIQDGARKVLVDGSAVTGEPRRIERFYYGRFVADAVARACSRANCGAPQFAYVLKPPVLDTARLGETVAVSHGMVVKAFDDLKDALSWLRLSTGNAA